MVNDELPSLTRTAASLEPDRALPSRSEPEAIKRKRKDDREMEAYVKVNVRAVEGGAGANSGEEEVGTAVSFTLLDIYNHAQAAEYTKALLEVRSTRRDVCVCACWDGREAVEHARICAGAVAAVVGLAIAAAGVLRARIVRGAVP